MSTSFSDSSAKCPFYKGLEKNYIICEGIMVNSSALKHCFNDKINMMLGKKEYCDKNFKDCTIFKAINAKY